MDFILLLDEPILSNNEPVFFAYVQFIDNGKIHQEFLFVCFVETDTKGHSVINTEAVFCWKRNNILKYFSMCNRWC